jgi:predicted dehydrogenase
MKRVLLIGYGRFGKVLYEKCNTYGNVVAICKTRADDYHSLLARSDIDLVVIATPTATHVSIAKDALCSGKDVFVEKPSSANPEEVKEVFALAEQQNKNVYVDDVFLWREEYQRLKDEAQKGRIARVQFAFQKYGTFDDTILNAHVYHDLYMLADLLGDKNITDLKTLSADDPLEKGRVDKLSFQCAYGDIAVEGNYDRASRERHKEMTLSFESSNTITWRDNTVIENDSVAIIPPHDALGEMIKAVLEDRVDYARNNVLALQATTLLHEIELLNH